MKMHRPISKFVLAAGGLSCALLLGACGEDRVQAVQSPGRSATATAPGSGGNSGAQQQSGGGMAQPASRAADREPLPAN